MQKRQFENYKIFAKIWGAEIKDDPYKDEVIKHPAEYKNMTEEEKQQETEKIKKNLRGVKL